MWKICSVGAGCAGESTTRIGFFHVDSNIRHKLNVCGHNWSQQLTDMMRADMGQLP